MDHRVVIARERIMREQEGAAASTVRRRLSSLSSPFKHLVRHGSAGRNPVVDVARPNINREEGSTAAFSKAQARKLLDAPFPDTLADVRDRAILCVGLQVRLPRAEIIGRSVGDLHQNRGPDALRLTRKDGRRDALAIHFLAGQRIRAYLDLAGYGDDLTRPLFRPLRGNAKAHDPAGSTPTRLSTGAEDAAGIGLPRGYFAYSTRVTLITTLENGVQFEDLQKAARHFDSSTTKRYKQRGHNLEKGGYFLCGLITLLL